MMTLKIFLSSTLRIHVPSYDPGKGLETEIPVGTTVADLCRRINVPADEVAIIMADGRMRDLEFILDDAERIHLFPAIGGG